MGTVRKRKWRGRDVFYIDYIAATGERVRQTIGPGEEGRRLARRVLAQREAEAQLGIHRLPATQTPTFQEFAEDWLQRLDGRNLAPKTQGSYEGFVRHHLARSRLGAMRLGAIARRDVELFLGETVSLRTKPKADPRPLSARSLREALRLVKAILADAVEQRLLSENPAAKVRPPVRPDREEAMHALTPEEIGRLLDVAEPRWRMLYLLAVQTGLRRGELLGLRWRDLDSQKGLLCVRRSLGRVRDGDGYTVREAPLKTKHSRRTIDLSPAVVQALLAHPAGDDADQDFVFRSQAGGPIDPDNVNRAFERHLTAAGLPHVRFHDLRHTHASLLIAAGVHPKAIQARLGHSSITVTMDRYGHLMPSAFEGVGARLDALLAVPVRQTEGKLTRAKRNAGPARRLEPAS
jgi:integrase